MSPTIITESFGAGQPQEVYSTIKFCFLLLLPSNLFPHSRTLTSINNSSGKRFPLHNNIIKFRFPLHNNILNFFTSFTNLPLTKMLAFFTVSPLTISCGIPTFLPLIVCLSPNYTRIPTLVNMFSL